MNIEIAPLEYYIVCFYDEAMLYCFQLEIDGKRGWRLPHTGMVLCREIKQSVYWQTSRIQNKNLPETYCHA
jgi:hypothetical protein